MQDQEFEQLLNRLMKADFAAGTESFREALLERCLAALGENDEFMPIDDTDLELLSAAGNLNAYLADAFESKGIIGDNMSGDQPV